MKTSTKGSFFVHTHGQAVHKTACLIRRRSVGRKKKRVPATKVCVAQGVFTPLKTQMEPKNGCLEDDFPFQTGDFQVPC